MHPPLHKVEPFVACYQDSVVNTQQLT